MRGILGITLSLLTFVTVASFIRGLTPEPLGNPAIGTPSRSIADKILYFEDIKDTVEVAFFGSSRMWAGIIPPLFDTEMNARGLPVRSFNFAMPAMHSDENGAIIETALAMKPMRLRWAVVELEYWNGHVHQGLEFRPRTIFWHDLQGTASAMRSLLHFSNLPRDQMTHQLISRGLHFGARVSSLGRGPRTFNYLWQRADHTHPSWLVEDGGFQEPAWGRAALLEHLDNYDGQVEALRTYNQALKAGTLQPDLTEFNVEATVARHRKLLRAGLTPLYVIPPGLSHTPHLSALKQEGIIDHLLVFNDPDLYPDLYLVENRWDPLHLSRQGSEIFSTLFAERFAELFAEPESAGGL